MPRKYEKVQELLPTVKALAEEGYTQRQIAEQLGLGGKGVVKELLKRERRKEQQGVPKQRGRKPAKTLQEYKYENKRLRRKGIEGVIPELGLISCGYNLYKSPLRKPAMQKAA